MVSFPLYGRNDPNVAKEISRDNPIEMLDAYDVRDGQLNMYVAYAGRDEFHLEAQAEELSVSRPRARPARHRGLLAARPPRQGDGAGHGCPTPWTGSAPSWRRTRRTTDGPGRPSSLY